MSEGKDNLGVKSMVAGWVIRVGMTVLLVLLISPASAEYVVTSQIRGNVCQWFGLGLCGFHNISAVKGSDGKLYSMATSFDHVSEYNQEKKTCWINTKSDGMGIISSAVNALAQPVFFEKTASGEYEKLDVEFLVFSCIER